MSNGSEGAVREQIEETRARIEHTRERMEGTLDEIGRRLNPDHLQQEITGRAKQQVWEARNAVRTKVETMMHDAENQVTQASDSVMETIKSNPIPAAMVGMGLAWLIANRRSAPRHDGWSGYETRGRGFPATPTGYAGSIYEQPVVAAGAAQVTPEPEGRSPARQRVEDVKHRAEDVKHRAEETAAQVGERAREATGQLQAQASDAVDRAQEKTSQITHQAQDAAQNAIHQAQYQAGRIERRLEDGVRESPMAAGAVALALGFAAGMFTPETRQEHRLMGPTRDRLVDRAQTVARHVPETAMDVARETAVETAKETMREVRSEMGQEGGGATRYR